MNNPKVLFLDIETSPLEVFVWDLYDQNISLAQIKKDWNVLAWSALWLSDPDVKIQYKSLERAANKEDDKALLNPLWRLLNTADIVITHNGARYDGPRLNARFILNGMNPPRPYRHYDTLQLTKRVADFTSNKLEYLTNLLCTRYKKLSHKRFPGWSLWIECLKGNRAAWDELRTYNIHDVLSLKEMFLKLRAWAPESLPKIFNILQTALQCRICGAKAQRRGPGIKGKRPVQRIQCTDYKCGAWDTMPLPK